MFRFWSFFQIFECAVLRRQPLRPCRSAASELAWPMPPMPSRRRHALVPVAYALLLVCWAATVSRAQPIPAPFPNQFVAAFQEVLSLNGVDQPRTSGAWFYDIKDQHWRADHHAPQANNFCACANNATHEACSLIFTDGHLFVDFVDAPANCCHLCDKADGCSPLLPTWISQPATGPAVFKGAYVDDDGRDCFNYCIPGAAAALDCWAIHSDNSPCQYSEVFDFPGMHIVHNLTMTSWQEIAPPPSAFLVRPSCQQPCPRVFPWTCG